MITGGWDETGRGEKKEKEPSVTIFYPLICYPVSLFLFSFLSLYFWATQLFFVFFFVHLLSSPVKSSLFPLFSLLLSVHSSPSLCLWFSCPLGPDTVPRWRKVCVRMPAGRETERFFFFFKKDLIREKRLNDRKQKIAY